MRNYTHLTTVAATFLAMGLSAATAGAQQLSEQVVKFAQSHLSKRVGDGQCAALATAALKSAGAKTTADYGVTAPRANYVWGAPVASVAELLPGDIIQFRDVVIVTKTKKKAPNGKMVASTSTNSFDHHTAIVAVNKGNGALVLLQQNFNGKQFVTQDVINLSGMTKGKIWMYRPMKK